MGDLLRGIGVIGALCSAYWACLNSLPEDPDYRRCWWWLGLAYAINLVLIADLAWRLRWVTF